jgi:radical SAM superfamily enzyme YgiQ (UPF0313 family)
MFSRAVRARSTEHVLSDLGRLQADQVFFYDDNFVTNKARTRALLTGMVRSGLTPNWFAQMRADAVLASPSSLEVDHELLDLMCRSGARMAMIGFETTTDGGLAGVGKRLTVAVQERAVTALHEHGIAVHGMFIAGLDGDDPGSAQAAADFARRTGIDTFQLMAETPLPGTKLWARAQAEGRILSEDWSLFDGHQVVMQPTGMSALDLQLSILEANRRFYSRGRAIGPLLSHLPSLAGTSGPALLKQLPALVRMAVARRWDDVAPHLRARLPRRAWDGVEDAFWVPALRLYARRQIRDWWAAEKSNSHFKMLRTLAARP